MRPIYTYRATSVYCDDNYENVNDSRCDDDYRNNLSIDTGGGTGGLRPIYTYSYICDDDLDGGDDGDVDNDYCGDCDNDCGDCDDDCDDFDENLDGANT